jgi:DNA-binding transcriptional LysR family regulator
MQEFRARYRNLKAALQTGVTSEVVDAVLNHRLDIGLIEGELDEGEPPRLGQLVLEDIRLYVIVGPGHAWWNRTSVPIDLLGGQPFVARQPRSKTRTWIDQILQAHHVRPDIVAELDNPESIKRLVMTGMGIAILPDYAIGAEREAGSLHALTVDGVPLCRTLKLVWDQDIPFPPVTRAFLAHLAQRYPQLLTMASA